MQLLALFTLIVTGFVSCAEFGSYAVVHPVLRHLPVRERVVVEKGLLNTFGRVMPIGMPLCVILSVGLAIARRTDAPAWAATVCFIAAVVLTLVVNVPINAATGRWDPDHPPADWRQIRDRWDFFQALRSWLLLIGFLLICTAVVL